MSDTAVAAPETTETIVSGHPQAGLTAPIHPDLQKLMERVLPTDGDQKPAEDPKPPETPKPDVKPDKPAAAAAAGDIRLAPDFEAPEKPDAPTEPEPPLITEEMIAAEPSEKKRANMRQIAERYEALKTELEGLKKAPKPQADPNAADMTTVVEDLKKKNEGLLAQLERFSVQASPLFQQQLVQPRQNMLAEAIATVKDAGGDAEAFERAMLLPDPKARIPAVDEVLEDIKSTTLRERVGRLIDGIDDMDKRIGAALKDAKGTAEQLRRQHTMTQHEQMMQQERQLKSMLDSTLQQFADGVTDENGNRVSLEVLKKTGRPEYKWWDDQVDNIRSSAEQILLKGTPDKMAVAAALAAACGPINQLYQAERKARKALEARLSARDDADPGNLNGKPVTPKTDEFGPDADITQVALTRLRRGDFNTAK